MDSRYVQQFKKGSMELILLSLIGQKETYGYEIITRLNQQGGDIFGCAKEGTIYPILYRLESAELIRSRMVPSSANGSMKKYYSLSSKGEATLKELQDFWKTYTECVNRLLDNKNL